MSEAALHRRPSTEDLEDELLLSQLSQPIGSEAAWTSQQCVPTAEHTEMVSWTDALSTESLRHRLQLFEYDCVVFDCEGPDPSSPGTVRRRVRGVETSCGSDSESSEGHCEICPAFIFDSGEYWCLGEGGERSDSVNITVTVGPLILESPVLPVTAGKKVTLRCQTNTNASDVVADFYRNGSWLKTGYRGTMVIYRASVKDSGLYKCAVSGYGESAESWLVVRGSSSVLKDEIPSDQHLSSWWISVTIVALLLLALGAVAYVSSKRRRLRGRSAEPPPVYAVPEVNLPDHPVYAEVTKKSRARPATAAPSPHDHQYGEVEDYPLYSLVQVRKSLCGYRVFLIWNCRAALHHRPSSEELEDELLLSQLSPSVGSEAAWTSQQCVSTLLLHNATNQSLEPLVSLLLVSPDFLLLLHILLEGSCCGAGRDGESSLRIIPSRLQVLEYDCVVFDCEGPDPSIPGTVRRRVRGVETFCGSDPESSVGHCELCPAFTFDSGEYWCHGEGGERSDSVNITVGPLILESPVLPVTAGEKVTLRCQTNTNAWDVVADFYRNGSLLETGYRGTMVIYRVSVKDSGLYKCAVPGYGESAESWLVVRGGPLILEIPVLPVTAGDNVTLWCHTNTNESDVIVDFYRNGSLLETGSRGTMVIYRVSVKDSGLYKCAVSGYGESAESWLVVRDQIPSDQRLSWWITVTIVAPLLLALGAVAYVSSKRRRLRGRSGEPPPVSGHPVYENVRERTIYDEVDFTTKKSRARPPPVLPHHMTTDLRK
ncbi:uncharacterized protein LOC115382736 [Salarias fasciatus]|uniref:uncharacterized protein LOC115382736 n=1 Tax=Salarias fasciatus TaxID=181472 RepID=UPI00117676A9|nr:uncharacterized protein LOC115382736 [Salarias fasciatus]